MKSLKHLQPSNWNIPLNSVLYDAEINRNNPTAIVIMIDQSGSMGFSSQKYKGEMKHYSEIVAEMVNDLLNELIGRCTKSEGVRDYFDICVLGYGGKSNDSVEILWEDGLKGEKWVSVSKLKANALYETRTVSKSIRGKVKIVKEDVPYWFSPVANYGTPMGGAFQSVHRLISEWIKNGHENSYPPVVINITDGMQTDVDNEQLINEAKKVQALNTKDGNTLVLNCHISGEGKQVLFPLKNDELADDHYSNQLFEMSSIMPSGYNYDISNLRADADVFQGYRGMAFNANMDTLFNFIDIGTSGSTQKLTN
jgi:hypothetical protein